MDAAEGIEKDEGHLVDASQTGTLPEPKSSLTEDEEAESPQSPLSEGHNPDTVADPDEPDEDSARARRKDTPEGLVWVVLQNSKAPDKFRYVKALVPKELSITEIRRMVCSKLGCPFKELQLQMDGEHMWAGRKQPFLEAEDREYKVKWRKVNRLAKYIEAKQTGGVKGTCAKYGRTILHYIAIVGDVDLFQEAVGSVKADPDFQEYVNARDKLGDTALTLAAIAGYVEIVGLCLEREADVEIKNQKGRTAILLAAEHGHQDVVQTLLFANAELDPSKGTTCPGAIYLAELNQRDGVSKTIAQYLEDLQGANDDF
mmetsp:Transcript_18490/g.34655  ORF Transcript_18490/g.34655 Transcript_18490/m.34655 type:complete len:315 (-) Transcript_18490:76-1020(-)